LQEASPSASVLVIDDASSDPCVVPYLQRWTGENGCRRLLVQASNVGFVRTANRGMQSCEGDLVLLNSDTLVTPGWLEALQRCLASSPDIATATPWSNNAEICSFPAFCAANPVPESPAALARAARDSKQGDYPELPTAVGFCMAISRTAINRIGLFDEASFGLGYGEENDFSLRARVAGMRNVLCDDAYVVHLGGQSFTPRGLRPGEDSMARLLAKHPAYLEEISQWIQADPLASRRTAMQHALND
jgi:GT2 family glycosyltransferase